MARVGRGLVHTGCVGSHGRERSSLGRPARRLAEDFGEHGGWGVVAIGIEVLVLSVILPHSPFLFSTYTAPF